MATDTRPALPTIDTYAGQHELERLIVRAQTVAALRGAAGGRTYPPSADYRTGFADGVVAVLRWARSADNFSPHGELARILSSQTED